MTLLKANLWFPLAKRDSPKDIVLLGMNLKDNKSRGNLIKLFFSFSKVPKSRSWRTKKAGLRPWGQVLQVDFELFSRVRKEWKGGRWIIFCRWNICKFLPQSKISDSEVKEGGEKGEGKKRGKKKLLSPLEGNEEEKGEGKVQCSSWRVVQYIRLAYLREM